MFIQLLEVVKKLVALQAPSEPSLLAAGVAQSRYESNGCGRAVWVSPEGKRLFFANKFFCSAYFLYFCTRFRDFLSILRGKT